MAIGVCPLSKFFPFSDNLKGPAAEAVSPFATLKELSLEKSITDYHKDLISV